MNAKVKKSLDFVKKYLQFFIYGSVGIATLVFALVFLNWALAGDAEKRIEVYSAAIVSDTDIATEYLVRQQFATDGLQLDIGSELIPIDRCSVNADFTSAGDKTVEIVYQQSEFVSYRATIDVHVIFVRAIEVETYPDVITVEDGVATEDDNFAMYVTLAEAPSTDAFGSVTPVDDGWRVKLSDGMYSENCIEDTTLKNFYNITYSCGNVSTKFSFYNAAGKSYITSSPRDVVLFTESTEAAQSDEPAEDTEPQKSELALVVTKRSASYQENCTGVSSGAYIYKNASGEEVAYAFDYELKDKEQVLKSGKVEELFDGGKYSVTVDGHTFTAAADVWQSAVVNGMIVEDNGYQLVIGSDKRILEFTYDPPSSEQPKPEAKSAESGEPDAGNGGGEPEQPADPEPSQDPVPKLTLYVTEYDMNPLLGTGNGYSKGVYIYTDVAGNSYKLTFYLQAWTWTYVPLSSSHSDINADMYVEDIIWDGINEEGHWNSYFRGTLYAHVMTYVRGEGFVATDFSAPEEKWLGAIMGL